LQDGQVKLDPAAFAATGPIQLRRVTYRGRELTPDD